MTAPGIVRNFILDWDLEQVLGEGTYGEVRLAVNQKNGDRVAVKIIPKEATKSHEDKINKEMLIQRLCKHENIIQLYGSRQDPYFQYLLLEFASGGELFDRIEPDVGMHEGRARKYYRQLLAGLDHLHQKGVVHRDIKPENLLLDGKDNLKITDFGLATVYKHEGVERLLSRACGTAVYAAPEVIAGSVDRPYTGPPADIWSCGVVLCALLGGELPWDAARMDNRDYKRWVNGDVGGVSPWCKFTASALFLLKKILRVQPDKRVKMADMLADPWLHKTDTDKPYKHGYEMDEADAVLSFSQPQSTDSDSQTAVSGLGPDGPLSFSQPTATSDMVLSQVTMTPGSSQTRMQQMVRRMTRFYVLTPAEDTLRKVIKVIEDLNYAYQKNSPTQLTVTTVDKRKKTLVFKMCLVELSRLLVDFRRSKGDGIEFKKCFTLIRSRLTSIITRPTSPAPGVA